jgi:hypothetical protein
MKKFARFAAFVSIGVALIGISNIEAGRGHSVPAPPPPVLCGCACADGSFVIVHAPDADSCPSVCESACDQTS